MEHLLIRVLKDGTTCIICIVSKMPMARAAPRSPKPIALMPIGVACLLAPLDAIAACWSPLLTTDFAAACLIKSPIAPPAD
jgi:hypothetical protein